MSITLALIVVVKGRRWENCTKNNSSLKSTFRFYSIFPRHSLTIFRVLSSNNKNSRNIQSLFSIMDSTLQWCDKFYLLWEPFAPIPSIHALFYYRSTMRKNVSSETFDNEAINKCVFMFLSLFFCLFVGILFENCGEAEITVCKERVEVYFWSWTVSNWRLSCGWEKGSHAESCRQYVNMSFLIASNFKLFFEKQ